MISMVQPQGAKGAIYDLLGEIEKYKLLSYLKPDIKLVILSGIDANPVTFIFLLTFAYLEPSN